MNIQLDVEDTRNKVVKENKGAQIGYIYLPKDWVGRDVVVGLVPKKKRKK